MSAQGMVLIGRLGLEAIRDAGWAPDAIGGLTMGADPVAYAVAAASAGKPPVIDAFSVRKDAKTHGTGRAIEGNFREGANVVVVGRSAIVGQPMANLLIQDGPGGNATVTVCHSRSRDLPAITRGGDFLIGYRARRFILPPKIPPYYQADLWALSTWAASPGNQ